MAEIYVKEGLKMQIEIKKNLPEQSQTATDWMTELPKQKKDGLNRLLRSGGGESRTRVQTRSPKAFYTFSHHLILLSKHGRQQPNLNPSPLISHDNRGAYRTIFKWLIPRMKGRYEAEQPFGILVDGQALCPSIKPIFLEN